VRLASWDGFVIHQIMESCGEDVGQWNFWATHSGAQLDLLWLRGSDMASVTAVPEPGVAISLAADILLLLGDLNRRRNERRPDPRQHQTLL
jgi:hypothetical protein